MHDQYDRQRRRRLVQRLLVALGVVVFLGQWVQVLLNPVGDFTLHWIFGRRFALGGFLYASGMHRPYPPFWAMASVPLTILPMATMRALLYPLGLLPLTALLLLLDRLTRDRLPLAAERQFRVVAVTLLLASRFLIRELPECGVNLMLVALTWGGVYFWSRRRELLGSASLGLAIALKCTPALFVVYFAWKRQWRMVFATSAAALLFSLSPMLWMGRAAYGEHLRFWLLNVWAGASQADPLQGVLGDEELWNLSLRPALARYLECLPPEHKGFCPSSWRCAFLDLDPVTAGRVVKTLMAALLVGVALMMPRRVERRDGLAIVWECASVSLLMLLYSPITWRQHCVGALPACYLVTRLGLSRGLSRWMTGLMAGYVVLVLALDRGVIGRLGTLILDSYGVTTWAFLGLLAVLLGGRALAAREESSAASPDRVDAPAGLVGARPKRIVAITENEVTVP